MSRWCTGPRMYPHVHVPPVCRPRVDIITICIIIIIIAITIITITITITRHHWAVIVSGDTMRSEASKGTLTLRNSCVLLDSHRGSSVKIGTIQRILAWALRKDENSRLL